jgi:solute carrier family 6 amino acid transporter-like protein 5/7/9/14
MGLAFVVYPEALSKIKYVPQLWSVLFFIMLFTLGIGSSVAQIETILTSIRDEFISLQRRKEILAFIVCFIFCLLGLPLTTDVR